MTAPEWLLCSPHGPLLQGLHQVAWADGVLYPAERDAVLALVRRLSIEADPLALLEWLDAPPSDGEPPPDEVDPFDRNFLVSQAIRLALEDGDYDGEERARIARWAEAWGMDGSDLAGLEAEVRADLDRSGDPFA